MSKEWLSGFEHVLQRPDSYVGSVKTTKKEMWTCNEKGEFVNESITYNPGLTRIYIEPVSNALDNKWNSEKKGIKMTKIVIEVNQEEGWVSVLNDGAALENIKKEYEYTDEVTNKKTKVSMYPVQLHFGYMRTGTNYNDEEKRKSSGRNGFGAKLTNAFSNRFIVECGDAINKKLLVQEYRDNRSNVSDPVITPYRAKNSYVKVQFWPDLERFKYPLAKVQKIDDTLVNLFRRYAYDTAMLSKLPVTFNNEKFLVKDLVKYVKMYFPGSKNLIHLVGDEKFSEAVLIDTGNDNGGNVLSHVSYVNGINTKTGGVHVDAWADAIFGPIVTALNKRKGSKGKVTKKDLYSYFVLFIRCEVDNPEFADGNSKDDLSSPSPQVAKLGDAELKKILKWNFVSLIDEKLTLKEDNKTTSKQNNKLVYLNKKLQHANWAKNPKKRNECVLYIVEGLSAKGTAIDLISSLEHGADKYGVYALKGKPPNCYTQACGTPAKVIANEEFKNIIQILKLKFGLDYNVKANRDTLWYGEVRFMTDQDKDGFHIRGLLQAFFYKFFSGLIANGYVKTENTPIVIVTGKHANQFSSLKEWDEWQAEHPTIKIPPANIEYIKGLGTFPAGMIGNAINNDPKLVEYFLEGDEKQYVDVCFAKEGKDSTDARKEWLSREVLEDDTEMPYTGKVSLSTMIDKEVWSFHRENVERSLPSMLDGQRTTHRKILYAMGNRPNTKLQVGLLSGFIASNSYYHHGSTSIESALVTMARGTVGENNIPLLVASGMFGNRITRDAAAPRYIITMLEDITSYIFRKEDFPVLKRQVENGVSLEPVNYVPVIPTLLVNGFDSIATGWSSTIPCLNPKDLVEYIKVWLEQSAGELDDADPVPLKPWYRGYKGVITVSKDGKEWISEGIITKDKDGYVISELPIGMLIGTAQEKLEMLIEEKKLKSFDNYHTPNTVKFVLHPCEGFVPSIESLVVGRTHIMKSTNKLTNMVAFNRKGVPHRYESFEELINEFCEVRLEIYEKRKEYQLGVWKRELEEEENKLRFVKAVIAEEINIHNPDDDNAVEELLEENNYLRINDTFKYLLDMPIGSMTKTKVAKLEAAIKKLKDLIKKLKNKSVQNMWKEELDEFVTAYEKFLVTRNDDTFVSSKKGKKK